MQRHWRWKWRNVEEERSLWSWMILLQQQSRKREDWLTRRSSYWGTIQPHRFRSGSDQKIKRESWRVLYYVLYTGCGNGKSFFVELCRYSQRRPVSRERRSSSSNRRSVSVHVEAKHMDNSFSYSCKYCSQVLNTKSEVQGGWSPHVTTTWGKRTTYFLVRLYQTCSTTLSSSKI